MGWCCINRKALTNVVGVGVYGSMAVKKERRNRGWHGARGDMREVPEEALEGLSEGLRVGREGGSHLARSEPEKYARVLGELGRGRTKSWIARNCGVSMGFAGRVEVECAEQLGQLKKVFSMESARNAMVGQNVIEDMFEDMVRWREKWEGEHPGEVMKVEAKDLRDMSVAVRNLWEIGLVSMGEATQIVGKAKEVSLEEARRMRDEMLGVKKAEVVDV